MLQCPSCANYGVYPVRRRWWQRLLRTSNRYYCQDCEYSYGYQQFVKDQPDEPPGADNTVNPSGRDDAASPGAQKGR